MEIPQISAEELQDRLEKDDGSITLIDVRAKERFDRGHVPGATNIPLDSIKDNIPDLPKNDLIVTYCGGGQSGITAAGILLENGYNAKVMEGFRAWEAAELPVETS